MQKIYAFDMFRFLLALCVVFGHTYIVLFKGSNDPGLCIQNLAVDGFFILSGFLIAMSYFKNVSKSTNIDILVINSIKNKIKRLYHAPFQDLIRFIAESRVIVTNTYHMAYWATLMGKKVVLYKPFSNRFDALQFKPVPYSGNITADIKKANVYPAALAECRQRNITFFEKVKHIIET